MFNGNLNLARRRRPDLICTGGVTRRRRHLDLPPSMASPVQIWFHVGCGSHLLLLEWIL